MKIPVYQPELSGHEKKYVNDCLDTNWISSKGKYVKLFEYEFAKYLNIEYAATVSNGTVALHLALLALGVGNGDEVIVPTFTYIASVNAITYTGAKPVFVDSLADSWQMDTNDVRQKITEHTKAVMAVHLYGHPCQMDELIEICKKNKIFLIEDAAEAIGSKYQNKYTGTFGDISAFSFYGNKTITTGEGGMVVTNDKTLYERVLHLKSQGLAKYREYWHDIIGYNYRMTNISAAIGLAQLETIQEKIKRKREIVKRYKQGFSNLPFIVHQEIGNVFHSYWMITILLDNPNIRENFRKYLFKNGIETRPSFYPVHTMPMYDNSYKKYPVAENIAWRGVNLPSFPSLKNEEIEYIIEKINKYFTI